MHRRLLFLASLIASCGGSASVSAPTAGDPQSPADGTPPSSVDGGAPATETPPSSSGDSGAPTTTGRDWKTHPAIADVPGATTLYALSDVHGGYDRLATLLVANGVLAHAPASSSDARWNAGAATLVVTGDMIDKGPSGVEVIELLMALQAAAQASGGRVIVTLGNHEAEFFVDPNNSKANGPAGIDVELTAKGIMPSAIASGADPRGAWLRQLPFGARVGGWFFSHAGDTQGRTMAILETKLEAAVAAHADYNDPEIVGDTSILESRNWYTAPSTASQNAAALGVKHIVFGHDPSALGPKGKIAVASGNVLLRIDCGMSPGVNDSTGMLLRVTAQGTNDVVEQLDASGTAEALFTTPR